MHKRWQRILIENHRVAVKSPLQNRSRNQQKAHVIDADYLDTNTATERLLLLSLARRYVYLLGEPKTVFRRLGFTPK